MESHIYLTVLLSITSVYLVGIKLPAIAYLAIPLSVLYLTMHQKKITIKLPEFIFSFSAFFLIILIAVSGDLDDRGSAAFIVNLTMAIFIFLVFSQEVEIAAAKKVIYGSIIFLVIVATIDTAYKFIFIKELDESLILGKDFWDLRFYAYKGSLFYLDSNALAFLMLPVVFLLLSKEYDSGEYRFSKFLKYYVFFLYFLTFSRAGYVSGVIIILAGIKNKYFLTMVAGGGLLVAYYFFGGVQGDQSLAFKFKEFNLLYENLDRGDVLQLLVGKGFGWGDKNFFFLQGSIVKTFIELGLLGLSAYLMMFFSLVYRSSSRIFYIAFLVFSQSSNFYLFPAFVIGLMLLHEKIMALRFYAKTAE